MKRLTSWKELAFSPAWNVGLITAGSVIFSLGVNSIVVQHDFITGGLLGLALLFHYKFNALSTGVWFFLLNLPLFAAGWFFVSKRFFFYSLYSVLVVTLATEWVHVSVPIQEQLYAAVAGGIICGAGSGLILRSLGSGGGLDVVAVILNQKYNFGIGKTYVVFNVLLFTAVIAQMGMDLFIASMILVFISMVSMEYVLSLFSQKKIVYIISSYNKDISDRIIKDLNHRATFIKARGAYTGDDRDILMTITNNVQLKRLEEVVFTFDPNAVFIVENTFTVIGSTFNKRKVY